MSLRYSLRISQLKDLLWARWESRLTGAVQSSHLARSICSDFSIPTREQNFLLAPSPRSKICCGPGGNRTHIPFYQDNILSVARIPVPPLALYWKCKTKPVFLHRTSANEPRRRPDLEATAGISPYRRGTVFASRTLDMLRLFDSRRKQRNLFSPHLEATAGIEPAMGVLQTPELPLFYVALFYRLQLIRNFVDMLASLLFGRSRTRLICETMSAIDEVFVVALKRVRCIDY